MWEENCLEIKLIIHNFKHWSKKHSLLRKNKKGEKESNKGTRLHVRKYKAEQREAIDQGRGKKKFTIAGIIKKYRHKHLHRYRSWYECWSRGSYGHW